jgi:peroxiredoxin
VLVYPGTRLNLDNHAAEFAAGKQFPAHFELLLDPDYELTNSYSLRWDAPNETAFPATFVIDQQGKVVFSKVSKSHGGRTNPAEVLPYLGSGDRRNR